MLMAAAAFAPACAQAPETVGREAQIRLTVTSEGSRTVDVEGLPSEDLAFLARATLSPDEWAAILRVEVASDEPSLDEDEWPAVLGVTAVSDGVLRFTPRFPFDPGQRYDVVFDPSSLPSAHSAAASSPLKLLHAVVEVPAPVRVASTHVVEVYPSGPEVPENHLRLYLVFSGPMSSSGGGAQVRLIDDQGQPVPDPFLPLELELWNEDRTRFTVLYDPGRVKRGIRPNEEMGRALVEGRTYTLVVGTDWRDAAGQPLVSEFRHEFRVGSPEERAIDPAEWTLELPAPGTRQPLAAVFSRPLDYGLLHRALRVVAEGGPLLDGVIRVEQGETRWVFTPRASWQAGEYHLVAAPSLEDVAGNRIGRPFEVASSNGQPLHGAEGASLPFRLPGPAGDHAVSEEYNPEIR